MQWPNKVNVFRENDKEGDGYLVLQQGTVTGIKRPGYGRIILA